MSEEINQFGEEVQKVLLTFMVSDADLFARSRNIIKDEYFDNKLRPVVRYIQEYSEQYKALPTTMQLTAMTGISLSVLTDINPAHGDWYLDTVEKFCRYRAIENVILDGPELLQKGAGAEIESRLREAMLISLQRDLGSQYSADPLGRLERLKDNKNIVPTHWKGIDNALYGGFARGSLNIFCGGSGSGKSLWMQNLALNWIENGYNVLYITLELSQDLTDNRVDTMVSGLSRGEMFSDIYTAAATISQKAKKYGDLTTKKFSEAGTTCNDLRAYLKEYTIQKGYKPDRILVDYLDLMYPNNAKVDAANMFVKDKYVSEELRSIAGDYDVPLVTASQLNRGSVEATEFDHAHIAGGISKINTADNVFAILYTTSMREQGVYELQFLKTRSAAAVGHKVKMKIENLRITDGPDEGHGSHGGPRTATPSDVRDELKIKTQERMIETTKPAEQEAVVSPIKNKIADLISNMNKVKQ
jgi:hypothetical protein